MTGPDSAESTKALLSPPTLRRSIAAAILISASAVAVMLAVRPLSSEDLGYHLLYGETFWRTGEIVDHNTFLYTLASPDAPPDQRGEPMAGAWYDDQGHYRFPNANWLTQIIFAGVYLVGGFGGLNVLLIACVLGLFTWAYILMRRLEVARPVAVCAVVLIGLIAYPRFTLRPELLGYVALAALAAMLAPTSGRVDRRLIGWRVMAGLVAVQWALTNLHSYFYIGLGLTGAVLAEAALRWVWVAAAGDRDTPSAATLRRNTFRLIGLLAAQIVVCFANPWTWRLVILPLQTALYLRQHDLTSASGGSHPWLMLLETQRTFLSWAAVTEAWDSFLRHGFRGDGVRALFTVAVGVSAVGGVMALLQRRWAQALWLAAGLYVSLMMYRSMAIGTLLMLSVALAAWRRPARWAIGRMGQRIRGFLAALLGLGVVGACVVLAVLMISGRFYLRRHQVLLGPGRSRVIFPAGPAQWFNQHQLRGRIWTDFITSSNLYFLLDPRPEFPLLTNGWAYPPSVMREVFDAYRSEEGLAKAVSKYNISALVARPDRVVAVFKRLRGDLDWTLVYLDGAHAIFLRTNGPDAAIARREALTPYTWDRQAFLARAMDQEIWPAYAITATGSALIELRWNAQAVEVMDKAVEIDPTYAKAWRNLGLALANRAVARSSAGDGRSVDDYRRAAKALRRCLELEDNRMVRSLLGDIERQLRQRLPAPMTGRPR